MKRYNYKTPVLKCEEALNFEKFAESFGYLLRQDELYYLDYVQTFMREVAGYTITVTEISDSGKAIASIEGKDWHKINKYRWEIAIWDVHGTMTGLKYDNEQYDSYDTALLSAIKYILNNYGK